MDKFILTGADVKLISDYTQFHLRRDPDYNDLGACKDTMIKKGDLLDFLAKSVAIENEKLHLLEFAVNFLELFVTPEVFFRHFVDWLKSKRGV